MLVLILHQEMKFGAITFTENVDLDKYYYSRYGIGFDTPAKFTLSNDDGFGEM